MKLVYYVRGASERLLFDAEKIQWCGVTWPSVFLKARLHCGVM